MRDSSKTLRIELRGQELVLHSDRAMFWSEQQMLILSDLHLGKEHHFRKNGIALPTTVLSSDINRLKQLVEFFSPRQVLFVGDLFHSVYNKSWEEVARFFLQYPDNFWHLVPGNHDILEEEQYDRAGITIDPLVREIGPFLFSHDAVDDTPKESYVVSGHIHPGIKMTGKGAQSITLPCFYIGAHHALLPAFGKFTGVHRITPKLSDRVYVIAEGSVLETSHQNA